MQELFTTDALLSIFTLTLLEVILGVDNIIFISIISGKLPPNQQSQARNIGLILAMVIRIGLLLVLGWIMSLEEPLFNLQDIGLSADIDFSGKDIIVLMGGLFLIYKATSEIHHKLEGETEDVSSSKSSTTMYSAIFDITLINIVFSIDSIITAIGMTDNVSIMAVAIVLSTAIMLVFAKSISEFVEKHPTVKILALSFLVMIGTMLVAEAFHFHVPKGYIYFAMAFSLLVEILNINYRKKSQKPVELHSDIK